MKPTLSLDSGNRLLILGLWQKFQRFIAAQDRHCATVNGKRLLNRRYSLLVAEPVEKSSDEASSICRHSSFTMPCDLGYCAAPPLDILVRGVAALTRRCGSHAPTPTRVALSGILK